MKNTGHQNTKTISLGFYIPIEEMWLGLEFFSLYLIGVEKYHIIQDCDIVILFCKKGGGGVDSRMKQNPWAGFPFSLILP